MATIFEEKNLYESDKPNSYLSPKNIFHTKQLLSLTIEITEDLEETIIIYEGDEPQKLAKWIS